MRRSIVVVLTLLLVAVLAVPAFGAELEVSGKYVGEIEYNRTLVNSINAGGETEGFDLLGMSTLYLTLDFAEGETVEGHLPLMFYIDGDGGFAVETQRLILGCLQRLSFQDQPEQPGRGRLCVQQPRRSAGTW